MYKRSLKLFLTVLCLLSAVFVFADGAVKISVPANATAAEKYAAKMLQNYLAKVYKIQFAVVNNDKNAAISVGSVKEDADLGDDGFDISCDGKKLSIVGGSRTGSGNLYGVFEYLENVGCRFMTATEDFIPSGKKFELLKIKTRQKPAFPIFRYVIADGVWGAREKLRLNGGWGKVPAEKGSSVYYAPKNSHTSFYFMPPKKYSKTNPEFYAIHKGLRTFLRSSGELCFSNQAMAKEYIANVKKYLKTRYKKGAFLVICPEDNQRYCECQNCNAIYAEEGTKGGTLVRFINQLASAIEKDYPDLLIKATAYQYYRFPPKKTKYHKNVVISLCNIECDFTKAFTGAPENVEFMRLVNEWKKCCSHLMLGDYGTTFDNYHLPFPNFDALGERLNVLHKKGFEAAATINPHTGPGAEFAELRTYMTARLYWNPALDPWKIAADFCDHYYGKGGKYLLEYIKFYHKFLKEAKVTYYWNQHPEYIYDAKFVARAEEAFRQAYAAVGNDAVLKTRLDRSYFTVQMMKVLLLKRTVPDSKELQNEIDKLEATAKRFKINAVSESINSIKNFLQTVRFRLKEVPDFCKGKKYYVGNFLVYYGSCVKKIEDANAYMGSAIRMTTNHNAWLIQAKNGELPGYNSPVRYDAYVRVRVEPVEGVSDKTWAFSCGVHLPGLRSKSRNVRLSEVKGNTFKYIKIAEDFPSVPGSLTWVAPLNNPKQMKYIVVDHFLFVQR